MIRRFLDEVGDTIDNHLGKDGNRTVLFLVPINKLYELYNSPRNAEEDSSEQSRNGENKYQKRVITSSTNVWQGLIICM